MVHGSPDVPPFTPVTTPVLAPTVALAVAALDHAGPGVGLLSVIVLPTHTDDGPVIGPANAPGFTVMSLVTYAESHALGIL